MYKNARIISILIAAGADPNTINGDGKTAIQLADMQNALLMEQEFRINTSMTEMKAVQLKLAQQEKTIAELKSLVLNLIKSRYSVPTADPEKGEVTVTKEEVTEVNTKKETRDYSNFYPDWMQNDQ